MEPGQRFIITALCVLGISALACGTTNSNTAEGGEGGGFKLGFEGYATGEGAEGEGEDTEGAEGVAGEGEDTEGEDTEGAEGETFAGFPPPSAATIERAREAGMPDIEKGGVVAGPFEGPEGTLLYFSQDGHVSFYNPQTYMAYFATAQPFRWVYGISGAGYFQFDANNQAVALQTPPDQLADWPMAVPMAQQIAAYAQKIVEAQERGEDVQAATEEQEQQNAAIMSQISKASHDTTMSILNNIGNEGCTEHYEGVYYIGCW